MKVAAAGAVALVVVVAVAVVVRSRVSRGDCRSCRTTIRSRVDAAVGLIKLVFILSEDYPEFKMQPAIAPPQVRSLRGYSCDNEGVTEKVMSAS